MMDECNCGGLVRHASIKCANIRVEAIPGISGKVEDGLEVDDAYERVQVDATAVPIDTLVNTALEGVNAQAEEVEVEVEDGDGGDGDGDGPINSTGDMEEFSIAGLAGDLNVDVEDVFSDDDDN